MMKIMVFAMALALVASVMVMSSQQANALTVRTVFDNRHTSASFGDSRICGDHLCAKGEKPMWIQATWGFQRINSTKIPVAQHGEDIMSQLAKASVTVVSTPGSKNMLHK